MIEYTKFLTIEEPPIEISRNGWPIIWEPNGGVPEFVNRMSENFLLDFETFVPENESFASKLPPFKLPVDENPVKFDTRLTYYAMLCGAYAATYLSGISEMHLKFNPPTPKIITSIARYHLYFQMRKFILKPELLEKFDTSVVEKNVKRFTDKTHYGREEISTWIHQQPNRAHIKHARYFGGGHDRGILGIKYQIETRVVRNSFDDWLLFVAKKSNGLTPTGTLLLQESIESFVYAVLGAQARTRWPITGQGAKSLQTQADFRNIVENTILEVGDIQSSVTKMRKAIRDTNVVLNTAIVPGVILIPSRLIILERRIDGFNNTLTLANSNMKFGINAKVNEPRRTEEISRAPTTQTPVNTNPPGIRTTKFVTERVHLRSFTDHRRRNFNREILILKCYGKCHDICTNIVT